jgi:hypothetical protein
MMDDEECGAVDGMIGQANRCTRRKPAPVPYPPQIPHDLTRAPTRAAAMGRLNYSTVIKFDYVLHVRNEVQHYQIMSANTVV